MTDTPVASDARSDTLLAIRNVLKLGGSLFFTWTIAVVIRLLLPRYLGPQHYGTLTFADAFTTTFFVALGLGVDVYVRRHVSVRPAHASDFFGGTLSLRLLLTAVLVLIMGVAMHVMGRPPQVQALVYLFAAAQFLVGMNTTLAALLQARGRVGGLSVLSVVSKLVWGTGIGLAMLTHTGLWAFAAALVLSEGLKATALFVLARRHLGLVVRLDSRATRAMVLASLPYYLTTVASTAYGKLDITLLALLGNDHAVGWYAGAGAIAGLTLLVTPLIDWVLMPTFARAEARSREELYDRVRSATRLVLGAAIPASLVTILGAHLWVRVLFGAAYDPAALPLQLLATTFVFTYVNIIYAITLTMIDRAWALTAVSGAGLVVNVALNLVIIRPAMAAFGDGGGGAGCALAMLGTELFVTASMIALVGRGAFDRRTMRVVFASLGGCALAVAVDRLPGSHGIGHLALDMLAYFAVAAIAGLRGVREGIALVASAVRRTPRPAPAASANRS